jgi:hypothetical protein
MPWRLFVRHPTHQLRLEMRRFPVNRHMVAIPQSVCLRSSARNLDRNHVLGDIPKRRMELTGFTLSDFAQKTVKSKLQSQQCSPVKSIR